MQKISTPESILSKHKAAEAKTGPSEPCPSEESLLMILRYSQSLQVITIRSELKCLIVLN